MKIALIGANSYIARNLISIWKKNMPECEIFLYDITEYHVDGLGNYTQINVLDRESVANIDMKCDIIYMFSGKTGSAAGFVQPELFVQINEIALLNILNEYRVQQSEAKLVFPSTRLVYKGEEKPLKEDDPKEFKTIYAINKYACEQYLEMYHRTFGVKYLILRICIPYGTLIPNASSYGTLEFMLGKATKGEAITLYGEGAQRRTFTYMGDLCDILMQAGISLECCNDVYNIGGEDYSLNEVATIIAQKYDVTVKYVEWPEVDLSIESGSTVFDSTKLDTLLNCTYHMQVKEWIKS